MEYKTILVHLRDAASAEPLLAAAGELAETFGAHLIGLHVLAPLVLPSVTGATYDGAILDTRRKTLEEEARRVRAVFDKAMAGATFASEWRFADEDLLPVSQAVARAARVADLAILGQANPDSHIGGNDVALTTVFDGGRPVLVIPYKGGVTGLAEHVLVAWNGRREAARAIFDALPLLQKAKKVHIVTVDPQMEAKPVDLPGADLATALARHGVNCETHSFASGDAKVGEALIKFAAEQGINLMVMGCYGHSRLREFVFGGATKHILTHMSVPVLMSH